MFPKLLSMNPMLGLGILMLLTVAISSTGYIPMFNNPKLKPTSCRAALVKLEKNLPQNWKMICNDNNLEVVIREMQVGDNEKDFRAALYRQLANYLVEIARRSEIDILEKVFIITVKIEHSKMEIRAATEGQYIVKLATLNSNQFVMDHLKQTVQVKEVIK